MATFFPVAPEVAAADAVNVTYAALIPPHLLDAEQDRWYELIGDKDRVAAGTESLATNFHEQATLMAKVGRAMLAAHRARLPVGDAPRYLCAEHALSKFVSIFLGRDTSYADDTSEEFTGTTSDKFLIDHTPSAFVDGAYGVVIDSGRLAEPPFEGDVTLRSGEPRWYRDENLGLYLSVSTPAVVSPEMKRNLILTAGDQAEAILDAEHSATVRPYLSLEFLQAADRPVN